jgi:hypothetical protein
LPYLTSYIIEKKGAGGGLMIENELVVDLVAFVQYEHEPVYEQEG